MSYTVPDKISSGPPMAYVAEDVFGTPDDTEAGSDDDMVIDRMVLLMQVNQWVTNENIRYLRLVRRWGGASPAWARGMPYDGNGNHQDFVTIGIPLEQWKESLWSGFAGQSFSQLDEDYKRAILMALGAHKAVATLRDTYGMALPEIWTEVRRVFS